MTSLLAKTTLLLADAAAAAAPATPAPAAGAPGAAAPGAAAPSGGIPTSFLVQILLFGAGFYFLIIRPQQKKAKETARKQSELKTGDKVATAAGIIGKVVSIDDKTVTLQVSEGVRIPFQRAAIVEFLGDETAKA